ncbi:hypothetical protein AVEN_66838-1 [Araneus ventricosus]|uniref:Uncharacterized protein n=1 Tax=Araneus ventricosus TaxID=182803 RepID=A0A4Y2DNY1_ARAVE|nr:hypothetical protein AVEN_66838-1 [Araneus ventricosus]
MVVGAFVPSVHQRIETDMEEISVEVVESRQDGLLNFGIVPKILPPSRRPRLRQRLHLLTETLDHYGTSKTICQWLWNPVVVSAV